MKIKALNNLPELFFYQCNLQSKDKIFLSEANNKKSYSWHQVSILVKGLAKKFNEYVSKGDRCLLISENRPEWMITDLAIMSCGGITVPAYTTYTDKDYAYIIDDCKPTIIIVSNSLFQNKITNSIRHKHIKKIFSFTKNDDLSYIDFIDFNKILRDKDSSDHFYDLKIGRKDPACIIYTSGTQGNPKGVVLSHGGILSNCEGAYEMLKPLLKNETVFLTWLPLSHSYEHTVQFLQIMIGAKVFYAESIDKLINNMMQSRPNIMTAVPRFYQGLYQKINAKLNQSFGLQKILINKTLELGEKALLKNKLTIIELILNKFLDLLVRKKVRRQFGGNIKAFISGGGPLEPSVGIFLNALGLPTLQGYGLTEASPIVSCNPLDHIRIDTVGRPFNTNKVKIADDGEILVKGENIMLGYWNNHEETKKILKKGWLFTGDIGCFEGDYLKITDRKKDILISPGGDNISPARIENFFNQSELFFQTVIFGDNKPFLSALIVLECNLNIDNLSIKNEIDKINQKLTSVEKIKKFIIVKDPFTIDNGFMTPSMKLKRNQIIKKYETELEALY